MPFEITQQNASALQPLFKPWEEPTRHRLPNPQSGQPAIIAPGRRPSKVPLVRAIRAEVDAWRRGGYAGVSETSHTLLHHWFESEHLVKNEAGDLIPFRYHWAQREAIETFIYLYELRRVRNVAELLFEFGDQQLADLAFGIPPEQDRWARYCAKIATGAGKTKIMSLAIVWSYFHSLYEPNSDLARHFVVIAPNLTVYERLKDDFENCAIFYADPLIPEEWRPDFQMQVVLQDEPGGATTTGALYLTNIHRLYPSRDNGGEASEEEVSAIFGPPVVRGRALDTGESLRARITAHPRLMVLNDEAHHLHDPDLAWNRAIDALHEESLQRGQRGLCLQLDFTATPKHNDGSLFRHIVVDFPLGEAVDAGIVKVPVLGESDELVVRGDKKTPAHERYGMHLQLGYQRYARTYEELGRVRKPVLFVMTEDAQAANEVADYLDSDAFPLLKGRVLNIHTRLKGRIKTVTRGGRTYQEFVENETAMKADDLRALREMSRELDSPDSKFRCVVSVMMLREGWDVRNVTTIVPLRPYSARSGILPEQTLGRGLRRMFPLGEMPEIVTVIEHPAFRRLYEDELAQEGLDIALLPVREVFKQTVTIFVDHEHKPVADLDIEIPQVSDAVETTSELQGLTFEEIRAAFQSKFKPLPIGRKKEGAIEYKERHLFTDEIVATMKLDAGLLNNAWSAPSYFAQMLGRACRISNPHQVLAPLVERFIAEVLFERPVDLYSGEVDHRMRDMDVMEHIRATFTPLILEKTVRQKKRQRISRGQRLSTWKPYQATSTAQRPALPAERTLFNLVPCDNDLEQAFTDFLETAQDVVAFAKNAGPQKLMLDYLKPDGQRAFYVPDFFVRTAGGDHYLVELKGRQDELVPLKASAAVEWCKTASGKEARWHYLYVPYHLFQQGAATTIAELARACEPSLKALLDEWKTKQLALPLEEATTQSASEALFQRVLQEAGIAQPPAEIADLMRQAVILLDHAVRSRYPTYAHAFQPLLGPLDEFALHILEKFLKPAIPANKEASILFFSPDLNHLAQREQALLERNQRYLRDNLVFGRSIQRLGTLLFCLHYAHQGGMGADGIWKAVSDTFSSPGFRDLYELLERVNEFRNTRVAHVETPLNDADEARGAMTTWLQALVQLHELATSPL
ncbi:DEAD/DEAH box helicase family protein [Thermosynechococcus vestitus]|uniref:Type III restriction-modification enzyme helicase subunit n=1 Tax=Thermosynechococcus vestitus (strain NIES-2133 / IAM M-273 / BP-1) TaxID=197221 RepID=Q8DIV1_THEVB|nr:DEAD/DEAH box helicase family protein [Thermosynechococcus vestitus]BAC09032.1 Type III restriction-modification enzyme helicase subunit [Thermosynechococcus vestitus BP-1]